MNSHLLIRIAICIFSFGFFLYSYIDKQNSLTRLRIRIPSIIKEIKVLQEENTRLQYEIDQFENPGHLMELSRHCEYSHLKHPLLKDILTMEEGVAVTQPLEESLKTPQVKAKAALAVGQTD